MECASGCRVPIGSISPSRLCLTAPVVRRERRPLQAEVFQHRFDAADVQLGRDVLLLPGLGASGVRGEQDRIG